VSKAATEPLAPIAIQPASALSLSGHVVANVSLSIQGVRQDALWQ